MDPDEHGPSLAESRLLLELALVHMSAQVRKEQELCSTHIPRGKGTNLVESSGGVKATPKEYLIVTSFSKNTKHNTDWISKPHTRYAPGDIV
ncbi:uncharacterized [Tachysurus ichikawai]